MGWCITWIRRNWRWNHIKTKHRYHIQISRRNYVIICNIYMVRFHNILTPHVKNTGRRWYLFKCQPVYIQDSNVVIAGPHNLFWSSAYVIVRPHEICWYFECPIRTQKRDRHFYTITTYTTTCRFQAFLSVYLYSTGCNLVRQNRTWCHVKSITMATPLSWRLIGICRECIALVC